jgi:hypothetical protein
VFLAYVGLGDSRGDPLVAVEARRTLGTAPCYGGVVLPLYAVRKFGVERAALCYL